MISVILPTYNEEKNVQALYERMSAAIRGLGDYSFEFVFVDDCSSDDTPRILEGLTSVDKRVKIIRFARNCGSHSAIIAGLRFCRGDAAIVLAADLQDPPELIPRLLKEWKKGGMVVWGVRERREKEDFMTRFFSRLFYALMNRFTEVRQPPTGADVFLADRCVLEALRPLSGRNTSIFMLISWLGFHQTSIQYIKEPRFAGCSKWNLKKRFNLFFDSLFSFSTLPLRLLLFTGGFFSAIGIFSMLSVIVLMVAGYSPEWWGIVIPVLFFLFGALIFMMGILGEYLWRSYVESRGRPEYVIEKNTVADDK